MLKKHHTGMEQSLENEYGGGEFNDTPWVFCMLNNFGGRLGLHGHLSSILQRISLQH